MIRTKSAQGYSSSSPDAEQLFSALDCTASASWCIKPAPRRTPAAAWKAARMCEIERCMADKRNQHPRQSVYMFKGLERAEDVRTAVYIGDSADKYRLKREVRCAGFKVVTQVFGKKRKITSKGMI